MATVHPDQVIIQANKRNRYGHPPLSLICSLAREGHTQDRALRLYGEATARPDAFDTMNEAGGYLDSLDDKARELVGRPLLPRPAPSSGSASGLESAIRDAERAARLEGGRFTADDVLITGEVGDIMITKRGAMPSAPMPEPDRFFASGVFLPLEVPDVREIAELKTLENARAYVGQRSDGDLEILRRVLAARRRADADQYYSDRAPAWVADYERLAIDVFASDRLKTAVSKLSARLKEVPEIRAAKPPVPENPDVVAKLLVAEGAREHRDTEAIAAALRAVAESRKVGRLGGLDLSAVDDIRSLREHFPPADEGGGRVVAETPTRWRIVPP